MTGWYLDEDDSDFKPWTLADIYDDLGSRRDVARVLDVNFTRVIKWIDRAEHTNCPLPVKRIGGVDIYSMQEWKDWFKAWLDPSRKGRRKDSKWVAATTYDHGKSLFAYERDRD